MTKKIIYEHSFLISGIMCYSGCGNTIHDNIHTSFVKAKNKKLFSEQAQLILDAEPQELGIHRIIITVSDNENAASLDKEYFKNISDDFQNNLENTGFEIINELKTNNEKNTKWTNWINILVNLLSIGAITALALIFPPSLGLTVGLTFISFLSTAFTNRTYLINFFYNIRQRSFANMTTTIALGWLLSLAHTLYHVISMPLVHGFSMIFMAFVMPILLITLINGMDELKRLILNNAQKMNLSSMNMLFPQMSEEYSCYQVSLQEQEFLANSILHTNASNDEHNIKVNRILENDPPLISIRKNLIKKGMLLNIKRGSCFPVDCTLVKGYTIIDASLLTGEQQQNKQPSNFIPSGAINLGETITVCACEDSYNSTINQLLFRSNRSKDPENTKINHRFTYLYTGLIVLGLAASLIVPLSLGILTIPLLLQNITGILFAVCPCTIAIGHQLPSLLNLYYCSKKNIIIRDKDLNHNLHKPHTVVFDKTGTLTTGNSQVESHKGISPALWARIYLLEKEQGGGHPLAKALTSYYETQQMTPGLIKDIKEVQTDHQHRGLCATIQGKKIHIGSSTYLQNWNIPHPAPDENKTDLGYTPVYVAEDGEYKGLIYIKHEIRENIVPALKRLKKAGTRIIMLTGDTIPSAVSFNQRLDNCFDLQDIHASQTPEKKESFLEQLMTEKNRNPKEVWFIGDGLNDAPCAKMVSEKKGVSCSMTSEDKASFFVDISLNGSIDYLFAHKKLNQFIKKNKKQNQALIVYGTLAFIAFIVSFSIAGIAVSPFIPLLLMTSTTLFVLFNSYRTPLKVDLCLNQHKNSWLKHLLASDLSLMTLMTANTLFIVALFLSTLATGGLALPALTFTAGLATAISSACFVASVILFGVFALCSVLYLCTNKYTQIIHTDNNALKETPDSETSNNKVTKKEEKHWQRPFWTHETNTKKTQEDTDLNHPELSINSSQ